MLDRYAVETLVRANVTARAIALHDGDLAEAILDRLLERGVHFALRGRSYRTRHLTEEESPTRRAKAG